LQENPEKLERERLELIQKSIKLNELIEAEEKGSSEDSDEDDNEEDEDHEKHWDCQSIISTYTNTDNHPAVIKTVTRVVKTGTARIELHRQFKVPLDGLMAEEITLAGPAKKTAKEKAQQAKAGPLVEQSDEGEESSNEDVEAPGAPGVSDKAAKKKQMKQEKREKRKLKKELKLAFQG
jgi:protein LTV1